MSEIVEFEDLKLRENILRGIFAYGFEHPSSIQQKAIPLITTGRDLIAQAQSGTGKTGTFIISTLQMIDENVTGCQAVVIAPTHELAQQIWDVANNLGQFTQIKRILCVGGTNIQESRKQLEKGPSMVIGTPGRINHMIESRYIRASKVKLLVMDEADEMLSDLFLDQIKKIVQALPRTCQICIFSATMPTSIVDLTNKFMNDPETILVEREKLTLDGISQFYIDVGHEKYKFDTFCDIFDVITVGQSMVYVNSKEKADQLQRRLKAKNWPVSIIHGSISPIERSNIMKDFRLGQTRILISTDLLSRGIDVQQVSVVLNYDMPTNKESYIHRIGRSGRFGRKGVAINLVTNNDFYKIDELKRTYSTVITPMPEKIEGYL